AQRERKNGRVISVRDSERPIEREGETTEERDPPPAGPHSTDTAAERGERGERRERGERGKRTRADIANYFAVFNRMTSQSAAATLNRMITTSLSRSLTPTLTRSLTQLLNRSFTGSTSLTTPTTHTTPATHLREEKREIKSERIRDIFNYFSTLDKVAARTSAASITQLITTSLSRSTQSPTPTPAQPLNRLLTRSLDRSTSFTTLLHEEIKEIKNERIREKETRDRRDRETTNYTTLIHQSPYTTYTTDTADTAYTAYTSDAAERTRTDIFNYFSTLSTLNNITSRAFAASINRLIAPSLTRSLTPGLTMSVTQLLTRSFSTSASSTTNLFSTLRPSPFIFQRIAAPASGASFTPAITPSLTRSFNHAAAFITYLIQKGNGEKEISPVTLTSLSAPSTQSETAATSTPATPRSYGEALKNKVPMPEVPGFERERLEFRHTSAFNLAGKQEAREAHTPQKVRPLVMPAKEWLSSRTVTDKIREPRGAGMDPPGERAAAGPLSPLSPLSIGPRAIDLRSLTGDGDKDPGRRPSMMRHADHAENRLSEDRIKKIEQTIAVQKKQFETRMKDTVVSSASSIASGISPGIPKGMDIARLTDNIYNLLVDKVKRERRMMGY
ncbi:MAG: hypothetical protein GY950_28110, partial [bacterium]|nr:hypothetical protein [bacterium]